MKIYFAAPLFTMAERIFNKVLADCLRERHEVFLPQEEEQAGLSDGVFKIDKAGLDWCDLVVAILDGPDPDSGTCWECGNAYGMYKPVIGVRTDKRKSATINLMLLGSLFNLIRIDENETIDSLAKEICLTLRGYEGEGDG